MRSFPRLPAMARFSGEAILSGRYTAAKSPASDPLACQTERLLGHIKPIRQRAAFSKDRSAPVWPESGKYLDIGCGAGSYLKLAHSLVWQTYGLEPDPLATQVARRSGGKVKVGTLNTVALPAATFDAVTSVHSIEHARVPRKFLQQAVSQHLCSLTVPAMRRLLKETTPWASLPVRYNPCRAIRKQEQTIAVRREGTFEATTTFSGRDHIEMHTWSFLEAIGNRAMA